MRGEIVYYTLIRNSGSLYSRRVDHPLFVLFFECFSILLLFIYCCLFVCLTLVIPLASLSLFLQGCIERVKKVCWVRHIRIQYRAVADVFSARRAVFGSLQSRRQVHAGRTLFVWRDAHKHFSLFCSIYLWI